MSSVMSQMVGACEVILSYVEQAEITSSEAITCP